jgi:hypothetical protein
MTTQYVEPNSEITSGNLDPDAGYAWYLANRDEIIELSQEMDFLASLRQLETENSLAPGTAEQLKRLHYEASSVSETNPDEYAIAWDNYAESLSESADLATLARVYGERVNMPLWERVSATGVMAF